MLDNSCFSCGALLEENEEVCPYCNYQFSIELTCPRKVNNKCVHTNKFCNKKDWEICETLRKND